MRHLFIDTNLPHTRVLSRFRSIFSIRNGVYSPLQRVKKQNSKIEIYFLHPDIAYETLIAERENILPFSSTGEKRPAIESWLGDPQKTQEDSLRLREKYTNVVFSSELNIFSLFENINQQIKKDILLWRKENKIRHNFSLRKEYVLGSRRDLLLHEACNILPGVVLDTRSGPIIVDANAEISPFSYICGPLYVGPNSHITHSHISGGSIIGEGARISGEIQSSIIGDFSNKCHDGFIGHSIVGNWVNLGAMTTNSNLKNNYGNVKIRTIEKKGSEYKTNSLNTHQIKFGSLIGDCVKTAIGTLLPTGASIDAGANIFGKTTVPNYLPPFSWGLEGNKIYDIERFCNDARKIAERREQKLPAVFYRLAKTCHDKVGKELSG